MRWNSQFFGRLQKKIWQGKNNMEQLQLVDILYFQLQLVDPLYLRRKEY